MWATEVLSSPDIADLHVTRDGILTKDDEEKFRWAQLCIGQIGAKSITEPLCKIAHIHISEATTILPLGHWTAKRPDYCQHPSIGVEVMIYPTGSFSDIHSDATTVGRALCIDRCEKLWFMWPPTSHNLQLWAANQGLGISLIRYGAELEGGLVANTAGNGDNALSMPAGTLHSAFTLEGGVLSGINYTTAEDIQLAGRMLELQVERSHDEEQIIGDCRWFQKTATEIMSSRPDFVVQLLASIARLVASIEHFDKSEHEAWHEFYTMAVEIFQTYRERTNKCPCGKFLPLRCQSHFLKHAHEAFER